jgi:hypothetical protein
LSKACLGVSLIFSLNSNSFATDKLKNLEPEKIAKIVKDDITIRKALASADFTREIYDESCKFQDEIDTYDINTYVKGTKALFDADKSSINLIGEVKASEKEVTFDFDETLTFNIPFKPRVTLSGKVKLDRGDDGLIVYSREYWDQSIAQVISTAKF